MVYFNLDFASTVEALLLRMAESTRNTTSTTSTATPPRTPPTIAPTFVMVRSLSAFVKVDEDDSVGFASVWGAGSNMLEIVGDSPGERVSGARAAASLNAARDCSAVLESVV